jgi:uncharacterized protein
MDPAEVLRVLLTLGAGLIAGALNSVAGGGSFISFPALLFLGLPPVVANATNNTAMWLGTLSSVGAYREELPRTGHRWPAVAVSLFGSVLGAELLLNTPEATFTRLIPWLLLFATVVFAASDRLRALAGRTAAPVVGISGRLLPVLFAIAAYGGYFGAGIGILILAMLALSGWTHMLRMNAFKVLLAAAINGIAVVPFFLARRIAWEEALVLTIGAAIGGYLGARLARRLEPSVVRAFVVVVGACMTLYFFLRET